MTTKRCLIFGLFWSKISLGYCLPPEERILKRSEQARPNPRGIGYTRCKTCITAGFKISAVPFTNGFTSPLSLSVRVSTSSKISKFF